MNISITSWPDGREQKSLIGKCADFGRILAMPGGVAWTLALSFGACAWLLPDNPASRICSAAILVTALLLLATARGWRVNRRQVETTAMLAGLGCVGLLIGKTPPEMQIGLTPVLMTIMVLGVLAWSEWRFAPDFGQRGIYWAVIEAAHSTLWSGLGIAMAMLASVVVGPGLLWLHPLLFGVGAICGRAFGLLIAPSSWVGTDLDLTRLRPERAPVSDDTAADWWKGGSQ